jgi:radical SAM protein with 4Fe4S-binding SPASM domain
MQYGFMRMRKYYDTIRSNTSFNKTSINQKIKILRNLSKFLITNINKPLVIKNKPVIAQIEPNSTCNLRCQMCVREKIGVPIGTMKFEDFKKILDKLDCLFKLHLSGQGEPFLNQDLFKMIRYANKRGATVFFTTNGTTLSKEVIDNICKVDIGEIAISIDSVNKKKYENIRKGADFEKVLNNIKELAKQIKEKKRKTIVGISTVILKENIKEIPEFVELAYSLGIKKVGFQKLQEKTDYLDRYDSFAKKQRTSDSERLLRKEIEKGKKIAREKGMTFIFDESKKIGCIWPWRSIYITWNGFVTPCCKILDYREPYFGNILTGDFWKIWNGKNYQSYRKLLRKNKAPPHCEGCSFI